MYVANFDLRSTFGQSSAECIQTPLVSQLCQGIGLLKKLRESPCIKQLIDRSLNRSRRDNAPNGILLLQRVLRQLVPRDPRHAHQPGSNGILRQFARQSHTLVGQMVLFIKKGRIVRHFKQQADRANNVRQIKNRLLQLQAQFSIDLESPYLGQVITGRVKVQTLDVLAHLRRRRTIGRPQSSIHSTKGFFLRRRLILIQRVLDVAIDQPQGFELGLLQHRQMLFLKRLACQQQRFLATGVNIIRNKIADVSFKLCRGDRGYLETEIAAKPWHVEPQRLQQSGRRHLCLAI